MKMKRIIFLTLSGCILILLFSACTLSKNVPKEEFIIDKDSNGIPIGSMYVQIDRMFGARRRPTAVNLFYHPMEDAVCLQYRHDGVRYSQYWSQSGRDKFVSALETYKKDYEERNLTTSNKYKKLRIYGKTLGFLHWRLADAVLTQARANVDLELGYTFHDKFPFFTVNQQSAEYIDPITRGQNRTSAMVTLMFTRARADELASFFDQDFLDSVLKEGFKSNVDLYDLDNDYFDDDEISE